MMVKPTEERLRVLLMHLRYLRTLETLGGLGEKKGLWGDRGRRERDRSTHP